MSTKIPEGVELKRVTKTMYIVAWERGYVGVNDTSKYSTSLQGWVPDENSSSRLLLGTTEVDYEIPTDDRCFDEKQIEHLKKKKERIIADSRAEQTVIEAKIQSLMALENLA